MLRSAPVLEGLRQALRHAGFEPDLLLLAGSMADEEKIEFGAFVKAAGAIIEYARRAAFDAPGVVTSLVRVEDVEELARRGTSASASRRESAAAPDGSRRKSTCLTVAPLGRCREPDNGRPGVRGLRV